MNQSVITVIKGGLGNQMFCYAAGRALAQRADYLDAVCDDDMPNPSDLAIHLTRRARGVPLWASVLAYGTDA